MPSMAQGTGSGSTRPAIPGRALAGARGSAPQARRLTLRRQGE